MSTLLFELRVLGKFGLTRAGKRITLPRHKTEVLCAFLVLHPEPHAREKLAALFWGDSSDADARNSLRVELAALRKWIDPALLLTDRETVQWNPDVPFRADALQVRDALRALLQGTESFPDLLACAPNLLPDLYDDWVLEEREALRIQYCDTLLPHVQRLRAASEYARAAEFARRVLQADPANERAHQHLMFCFVQMGDRAAALKQYDACVSALRAELDVAPSAETTALYEWLKQAGTPRSLAAQLTNLPIPLTSFVGRQRETAELKQLLRGDASAPRARLVTLTGAGGSGKTRLAIQVATDLTDAYRDGVWWTELAPLHDAALVAQAVAQALGIQEQADEALSATLVRVLRERELLLVLDNCEHLIAACAELVYALLTQCPALQILATSRENLNVPGEVVHMVPLLSIPDVNSAVVPHVTGKLAELAMGFEGVRLFVERAHAVHSAFQLTDENTPHVVEICRRLDGMPLALELAAARVKSMSPAQIVARLNARLDLLNGGTRTALPRQQTLRALIDWSYDLLPDAERRVFERVSVFAGGWTLDAAVQVCASASEMETLDTLARLADKSLLVVNDDGARYTMLETIREYAVEKLRDTGNASETAARHFAFFDAFAKYNAPLIVTALQKDALDALEREHDNLRSALRWSRQDASPTTHLQLLVTLADFWRRRGYVHQGQEWTNAALAIAYEEVEARLCGAVHTRASMFAALLGEYETSLALAERALDWLCETDAAAELCKVFYRLAVTLRELGRFDAAEEHARAGLAWAEKLGDADTLAEAYSALGTIYYSRGDTERARAIFLDELEAAQRGVDGEILATALLNGTSYRHEFEKSLRHLDRAQAIAEVLRNRYLEMIVYRHRGLAYTTRPNDAVSLENFRKSLKLAVQLGNRRMLIKTLEDIAVLYPRNGHVPQAAQILGFALQLRKQSNMPLILIEKQKQSAALKEALEQIHALEWAALFEKGQSLALVDILTSALDERLGAQVEH